MTSTRDNPGAFKTASARGLRAITANALRLLRNRSYRRAIVSVGVDAMNLFEARAGSVMPKRYRCSCCGYEAHRFRHVLSGDRVAWNSACPGCDSRSRHRGLVVLLPRLLDTFQPKTVLHFAPEPVLRTCFTNRALRYETADLHLEDTTHTGIDLQRLPFADGSYDLVLCNHVLEHLPDDGAAITEISRVLSSSGVAIITVPGDFSRKKTVVFDGELPNGHYRDYGLDFIDRLKATFPRVQSVDMHALDLEDPPLSHAIRRSDFAFVCERRPDAIK